MNKYIIHHPLPIIGSALAAGLVLLFSGASPTLAQPAAATVPSPVLTVDAGDTTSYPISPDIYGMNFADSTQLTGLNLPVNRWGGNSTTRYNYQNDVTSLASDWYFENAPWNGGGGTQDDSGANRFIAQNNSANTKTLLTIPTIGYVANSHHIDNYTQYYCSFNINKYGPQTGVDPYRTVCGTGINASDGSFVVNDLTDTSVLAEPPFVHDWVSYLHTKFGASAPSNYELDNEPDLWYSTHRDVHPDGAGYDELFTRGRDYAIAIKAADPTANVFGPVAWGWTGYFYSAEDIADRPNDWWAGNDKAHQPDKYSTEHDGADFIPWYLAQMKAYADAHSGTRLLDYLDLHFYPQVPGVTLSTAGSATTKIARLRSTRDLWDPTYMEQADGSWIDQPVMLIPRMHEWVNANYPGTKLAITEYNWGGLENINGALTQADILGIFGREKLDLATLWDPPKPGQPGEYAFRMYLNYDGSGGHFGDTSIQSASTDQGKLSIYGSKDGSSGVLKLMVINKTNGPLTSSLNLSNFTPSTCMLTYTYSPANLNAVVPGYQLIGGGSISYAYPGQSITLLVIPPDSASCGIPASALAAPVLTSPKVGAPSYKPITKLAWKRLKGALSYSVQVKDEAGSPVFGAFPTKNYANASLGYGRYSWQVMALAKDGLTAFSPERTFDVTLLTAPKNASALRAGKVVFKWKGIRYATYHLEVWKDKGTLGETKPIDVDSWAKTSFKPLTLLDPGAYTWTVTVDGQSTPMPEWTFTANP